MFYKSEQMYLKTAVIAHFIDNMGCKNYKSLTNNANRFNG